MSHDPKRIPKTLQSKARRYMRDHGVKYLPALAAVTAADSAAEDGRSGGLPVSAGRGGDEVWLHALGVDDLDAYDPAKVWKQSTRAPHLAPIPIGVLASAAAVDVAGPERQPVSEQVVFLDFDAMPSGVVSGLTGTGRIVLERCMIGSLGVLNSPAEVQLVVLDFKGGLPAEQISAMPHVAAYFDGLQDDPKDAVSEICAIIEAEIERRERILRVHDVASIHQYRRKATSFAAPLPDLMVFATEGREYMELFQSRRKVLKVASSAAHVGVHLVLSGQIPGTEVDAIQEKLKFGISLRAANDHASTRVLGRCDAVDLPFGGHAYLARHPHATTELERFEVFSLAGEGDPGAWDEVLARLAELPRPASEFGSAIETLASRHASVVKEARELRVQQARKAASDLFWEPFERESQARIDRLRQEGQARIDRLRQQQQSDDSAEGSA